jgi:septal ring factor EnvC (AmiA/AmiB activator)
MMPKIVLIAGLVLCLIAAGLLGAGILGTTDSGGARGLLKEKVAQLQIKEEQVKAVEAELDKARLEAADLNKQTVALKARLEASEKELAASEQRLASIRRELERLSTRGAPLQTRHDPRPVERAMPAARRAQPSADPRVYETLRATEVHEQPAQSSRVISRIAGGTRINVVRSDGEWLEIVSKRGNPPGFILRQHAKTAVASN